MTSKRSCEGARRRKSTSKCTLIQLNSASERVTMASDRQHLESDSHTMSVSIHDIIYLRLSITTLCTIFQCNKHLVARHEVSSKTLSCELTHTRDSHERHWKIHFEWNSKCHFSQNNCRNNWQHSPDDGKSTNHVRSACGTIVSSCRFEMHIDHDV